MSSEPKKVQVKVLEYREMHQGIYCGRAKVQFPEGDIITVPVVKRCEVGDTIELYETPSV